MSASKLTDAKVRLIVPLLAGTILSGMPSIAAAQQNAGTQEANPQPAAVPVVAAPKADVIRSITVNGSQRLEPDTIRSYIRLRIGDEYSQTAADQALKDLFGTELFADVSIRNNSGAVIIDVVENPVINRIILEGNRRLKDDKILPEIRLSPRQIFTPTKVRADVARIIELYKRQGRFAATVTPKRVEQDQNRVDIVYEITEGPRSKVRQINIIGNEVFSDSKIRGEMVTKQSRFFRFFSSGDTYDPDKLAFDQQNLRIFYLTQGYADFRVVSAVAETTPDKKDFIITFVVEEGEKYTFGDVAVTSEIRDFDGETLQQRLSMKTGDPFNAKQVEDTVEQLSETAGLFGYAFANVNPRFRKDRENLQMNVTFEIADSDRVYVERIDINGNTLTQDKVVRREFRLNEGDAFNSFQVRRSTNRINSLGYFQENLEVQQKEGSQSDRIILEANVQERPTGELQLSAGFSSIENFIIQASIRQRNFRGKGQTLGASVDWSQFRRSVQLSFTEPYLFDRNISVGADIFRRDLSSFNFNNQDTNTTFSQLSTGASIRVGAPLTEFLSLLLRYNLVVDDVTLDENLFFADLDGDGDTECNPQAAGFFLCDAIGSRTTSSLGFSLVYSDLNNGFRPTRGQRLGLDVDFAGLGGSVSYLRARINGEKYFNLGGGFIFSLQGEGGHIEPFENRGSPADGIDDVRLTDRFFLGEPQIRGFDVRGVGPRVLRVNQFNSSLDADGNIIQTPDISDRRSFQDDPLGGRSYYFGRAELQIPLGSGAQELGLRPSVYVDVGSVFNVVQPLLQSIQNTDDNGLPVFLNVDVDGNILEVTDPLDADGNPNVEQLGFQEIFVGDTPSPRLTAGIGVNWNSPFGPFRIDLAYDILSEFGDDTKLVTFGVGTQF